MRRHEVLTRYRWILAEAETLFRQADKVMNIGIQAEVRSTWPTKDKLQGMPGGTNDQDSASAQKFDAYIHRLKEKAEELLTIGDEFENVLSMLCDDQERVICRKYYGLGMTDEAIAEDIHMDQSTVNRIRNRALENLKSA